MNTNILLVLPRENTKCKVGALMFEIIDKTVKISVRSLVEFILRSGDLDKASGGKQSPEAMQEGSRIHRKIQKRMGPNYQAEVPLSITVPLSYGGLELELCVEGRADGIFNQEKEKKSEEEADVIVDEIKGVYRELSTIKEAVPVHLAQAKCYAYIYALQNQLDKIGVRMTYCNIETENILYFDETYSFRAIENWFLDLVDEFSKWVAFEYEWSIKRNAKIKELQFPFEYRPGQKDLVAGVYRTIIRDKKLFIEAPTGVGKTISTVFPAVKAMGEGFLTKIFYLTAKTITRTVAEETFAILKNQGLLYKVVTITAKEKVCVMEKVDCNPNYCERAKGHYDRVNDAVYDLITSESEINRDLIEQYAAKHCVCPFEMSLDITYWCDTIICDYNYVFDPNVYLRRFFSDDKKQPYCFLVDEAHNLVDRAREMYSATLYKKDFLHVKSLVKEFHEKLRKRLETCNQDMLALKRESGDFRILTDIGDFVLHLMRLMTEYDEFLQENTQVDGMDEILQFYMELRHFLNMYEIHDERYVVYVDYDEADEFRIKLMCVDPSKNLKNCLDRGRSAVMFSATLLPIHYYKDHLGGDAEDYAIYAPSPFQKEKRLIMVGNDVTTRYTRRSAFENNKIVDYIKSVTECKKGNYFVFFPSYKLMNEVAELAQEELPGIVVQASNMTEAEKESFLEGFVENPEETRIGFCVMGGIFSEGIDLKSNRLIGTIIVGTGLPMVCNERELMRSYYQEQKGNGFDYAYLYQGMNKVLQSAGRVIRTTEDEGVILLLDDRFLQNQYLGLFPREWDPYVVVQRNNVKAAVNDFWNKCEKNF